MLVTVNVPVPPSNTLTRTLDSTAPVVTANPLTTTDTTPTLTGTVDDPTAAVSVTVAGETSAATVSGNTWSVDVTSPLGDGKYDVEVTAADPAGNSTTITAVNGLVIDTTPPTAVLTATGPNPTGAATIPFKITFSEPVTGLTASALAVTNGTASNLLTGDNVTFTFDVTPAADGPVVVSVPANAARDQVQLGNASSNTVTVTKIP